MTTTFRRVRKLHFQASTREIVDVVNQLTDLTVQKDGPLELGVKTLTNSDSPYTVLDNDQLIKCDTSSGNITVNLPAIANADGRQLTIKAITLDNNNVVVDGNASETIDGATTKTIQGQYAGLTIRADATTGWDILAWI